MLSGKHILLGVSGGIAAYKSAWLIRELVRAGAEVQVVMTPHATEFITPLTLSTLSRREVLVGMFPDGSGGRAAEWTRHIDLGLWADVMLVAPATANTIAKIACGRADDFLTTIVLALRCPLAIAPAMDVDMYRNETTQRNIAALREAGCHIIDPDEGELASGLSGPGRLPEVDRLLKSLGDILAGAHRDLAGRNVLVTAGPTHEPVDPVRYLGNRSSGKMGFALATAAAHRGAAVTLVAGPVSLRTPLGVRRIDVTTAREMQEAVDGEFDGVDLVLMAAAVADFAPATVAPGKIKRGVEGLTIACTPNPDILRSLGERKRNQILVGFALETGSGTAHAVRKLKEKRLDMIVLNNPGVAGAAFGGDTNVVTILTPVGAPVELPLLSKYEVAQEILTRAVPLLPTR